MKVLNSVWPGSYLYDKSPASTIGGMMLLPLAKQRKYPYRGNRAVPDRFKHGRGWTGTEWTSMAHCIGEQTPAMTGAIITTDVKKMQSLLGDWHHGNHHFPFFICKITSSSGRSRST